MMEVDGFILGENTRFTSIDDQAGQALAYVKEHLDGGKTYGEYLTRSSSRTGTPDRAPAEGLW